MKRLKSFAGFIVEALSPEEIVAKGVENNTKSKKGTPDKELDKAAAEGQETRNADKKEEEELDKAAAEGQETAKADKAATKKAPAKKTKVDAKAPAIKKAGRQLIKGGTEAVAQWQEKLVKAGYKIKVDGGWGKETQKAYAAFIAKKYGEESPKAKQAAKGTAPAVAKESPGAQLWSYFKSSSLGGLVAGAANTAMKAGAYLDKKIGG